MFHLNHENQLQIFTSTDYLSNRCVEKTSIDNELCDEMFEELFNNVLETPNKLFNLNKILKC